MISNISPRKILRNYAIPIFATAVFLIVFFGLWIVHQYALSSVGNLADTNPLIASDKNKLVSQDQSTDPVVEQFIAGEQPQGSSSASNTPSSTSGTQSQAGTSGQQPTTSGGSNSSGGKPSAPDQPPFTVSLGTMEYTRTRTNIVTGLLGILLGCTIDHQFKIAVNGQNGPGVVKYRWVRSTGGGTDIEQKVVPAGKGSIELSHSMTTSSGSDYWVSLEVYAPSAMEKKYSFKHQC